MLPLAYIGARRRFFGGSAAPGINYAVQSVVPTAIADFTQQADRSTAGEYFQLSGAASTFNDMYTWSGGLTTMKNSSGDLVWNAHNLLTYSEDFSNAAWGKTNATVSANAANAPDGTATADLIYPTTTGTLRAVNQTIGGAVVGVNRTHTVYVKAAGFTKFYMYNAQGNIPTYFDLTAVTVLSGGSGSGIASASITAVGSDGWRKCTVVSAPTSGTSQYTYTGPCDADGSTTATVNGTDGIYIWGAHLYRSNLGGMADNPDNTITGLEKYVATTSAAGYKPPRNSYEYIGAAWVKTGIQRNSAAATNLFLNSGTLSTQNVTTTAVPYTLHFTGTGTVTLSGTSTAGPLVGTGTGEENRVSLTFTPTAGTLTCTVSGTVTNAQIEVGSVPTPYIPTAGAAVMRPSSTRTATTALRDALANTTAISFAMNGRITYADLGAAAQATFIKWQADASNYIILDMDTDGAATGEINANQNAAGTLDTVVAAAEYSPGINVAFNIASRHTSGAINVAKDGAAATEDATPVALADLSVASLLLGHDMNGSIALELGHAGDFTDAGLAEVTT